MYAVRQGTGLAPPAVADGLNYDRFLDNPRCDF